MSLEKEIINVVNAVADKKTKGYDTPAQVVRVEGSTVWVHIPGGVDETPVQRTVNCDVGDTVQVRVSGGRAWITGNASNPPTDDTTATFAHSIAKVAKETADYVSHNAVTNVVTQYALGTSSDSAPLSGWSTESPEWTEGYYIWQRTVTTIDGVKYASEVACIQGAKGENGSDGEDATVLRIDSSRGNLFKNNTVSTVLTVTIQKGSLIINNYLDMIAEFGSGAYLEWKWKRINDSDWQTIVSTDSRITNHGFTFTLSPDDVDVKVVFTCILNV